MNKEYEKILYEFKLISKKKWIEGVNNTLNSVGLTFENMLGKNPDSMFMPDYNGIEIKCTQRYSRYPISLFSLSFEGKYLYQTNRLVKKYGTRDYQFFGKKRIQTSLLINKKKLINKKYYFELRVDKEKERLSLYIYNLKYKLIDKEPYIDFKTLEERLEIKLGKLAVVYASKKEENNKKYFRYYEIDLYELKNFETFIKLLENGVIKVRLDCRISRSGKEKGRQRNKGIVFDIPKDKIEELFTLIKKYNTDENWHY